jgi:Zn-finger nucleic acid-binding protein
MSLDCPICPHQPLHGIDVRGVHVDTCERCRGHWLERNELERLVPSWKTASMLALVSSGRCRQGGHRVLKGQELCGTCGSPAAHCPSCGEWLWHVQTEACAVEVCGRCHGIWLDVDELELLIRRHRSAQGSRRAKVAVGAAVVGAAAATAVAVSHQRAAAANAQQHRSSDEEGGGAGETAAEIALEATAFGLDVITSTPVNSVSNAVESGAELLSDGASLLDSGMEAVLEFLGGLFD